MLSTLLPPDQLLALDLEYAAFNSSKTVEDPRPSRFTHARVGSLVLTGDENRSGAYYHRLLGLGEANLPDLAEALEHPLWEAVRRVDLDAPVAPAVGARLGSLGFTPRERLVWMQWTDRSAAPGSGSESGPGSGPGSKSGAESGPEVVSLVPGDRERIRRFLEWEGAIPPELWALRREHFCTDRFRFSGVLEGGRLVALATAFVEGGHIILGNAFTLPEHRRRGYQSALLVARCHQASSSGARAVLTDVEPGTTSYENCRRLGFTPLQEQEIWERPLPGD